MKIKFSLPWGGEFEYHREPRQPMSGERFAAVCVMLGFAMFFAAAIVAILH